MNSTDLLITIPEELQEKEAMQLISTPGDCQKALGIHWDTGRDTLHVATPVLTPLTGPTKRQIASDVAKIFDLLGWFAPAVVRLKILLQKLWKLGNTWDEPVPEKLATVWRDWQEEPPFITNHPVPRCYYHPGKVRRHTQIHGFSDASNVAYGGVAYLRTLYEDTTITVNVIIAKTRSPLSHLQEQLPGSSYVEHRCLENCSSLPWKLWTSHSKMCSHVQTQPSSCAGYTCPPGEDEHLC